MDENLVRDVIDFVLVFLHVDDVLLQADQHISRLRRVVLHRFRNLHTVDEVLVDSKFLALNELFIGPLAVALVLAGTQRFAKDRSHHCESIDSESGVVSSSPSYLWEL